MRARAGAVGSPAPAVGVRVGVAVGVLVGVSAVAVAAAVLVPRLTSDAPAPVSQADPGPVLLVPRGADAADGQPDLARGGA